MIYRKIRKAAAAFLAAAIVVGALAGCGGGSGAASGGGAGEHRCQYHHIQLEDGNSEPDGRDGGGVY